MTQTTNGDGGAARPPDRAEIQRLVQAAAEQAAKALKAADRVAAGLAAAVQADADGMAAASREIEDALQAAGSDLLMAGALIQSHGWWLPENMQSIARLAQGLDAGHPQKRRGHPQTK